MRPTRQVPPSRLPTRQYNQRRRADHVAHRRAAIVAAAHDLLDKREAPQLTLDEVARAAGVTRATVYNQFGSRSALLAAVFEDLGRVIHYERVQQAQTRENPREALEATIREACRCWSSRRVAIRRILALGVLDPEIDQLNQRYEMYRRAEISMLAERLRVAGLLGDHVSREDATAILGALTGPNAFELLDGETAPGLAADRLVHIAVSSLGLPPLPQEHVHG